MSPIKATFALLDQFTFECHWQTVRALAEHPKQVYKIELFYFLAQGWIDRSLATLSDERGRLWWGNDEWKIARDLSGWDRAQLMTDRFRNEHRYRHAHAWQIFGRGNEGAVAYYMIHASDHDRAPKLMEAAYNERLLPDIRTEQLF